jgi:tRNA(fMet)-specific endonuclease VapC
MILLDSDHVSVLLNPRIKLRSRLAARLDELGDVHLPVVVVEEQMRGWLALIHRTRDVYDQIEAYIHLETLFSFVSNWPIAGWNSDAAGVFKEMRRGQVRIGTQDLKIASIALANDATLLSANLVDFQQVPGLQVEDWLNR